MTSKIPNLKWRSSALPTLTKYSMPLLSSRQCAAVMIHISLRTEPPQNTCWVECTTSATYSTPVIKLSPCHYCIVQPCFKFSYYGNTSSGFVSTCQGMSPGDAALPPTMRILEPDDSEVLWTHIGSLDREGKIFWSLGEYCWLTVLLVIKVFVLGDKKSGSVSFAVTETKDLTKVFVSIFLTPHGKITRNAKITIEWFIIQYLLNLYNQWRKRTENVLIVYLQAHTWPPLRVCTQKHRNTVHH